MTIVLKALLATYTPVKSTWQQNDTQWAREPVRVGLAFGVRVRVRGSVALQAVARIDGLCDCVATTVDVCEVSNPEMHTYVYRRRPASLWQLDAAPLCHGER